MLAHLGLATIGPGGFSIVTNRWQRWFVRVKLENLSGAVMKILPSCKIWRNLIADVEWWWAGGCRGWDLVCITPVLFDTGKQWKQVQTEDFQFRKLQGSNKRGRVKDISGGLNN